MLYWCAWGLLRALLFLRARLIITGLEALPKKGSLILVSNHISGFDPVLIGLAISKRRIRFMAKSELFRFIPFGWILWKWVMGEKGSHPYALPIITAILIHGLVDVPYFKNDLAILFWLLILVSIDKNQTQTSTK